MTSQIGVICAAFVAFFCLAFGLLALMRWFRHRESMAMIKQGMAPSRATRARNGSRRSMLVWGVGITAFGLVLLLAMGGVWMMIGMRAGGSGAALLGGLPSRASSMLLLVVPGLMVLAAGVALLILYFALLPTREAQTAAPNLPSFESELEPIPDEPERTEFKVGK